MYGLSLPKYKNRSGKRVLLPFAHLSLTALEKRHHRLAQHITRAEEQRYRMMHKLELTSRTARKARSRSLIQVAALCDKAGLLQTFGIILGEDLQKSPEMKEPVAALFKGFLILNEMVQSGDVSLPLWSRHGLEELGNNRETKLHPASFP